MYTICQTINPRERKIGKSLKLAQFRGENWRTWQPCQLATVATPPTLAIGWAGRDVSRAARPKCFHSAWETLLFQEIIPRFHKQGLNLVLD